MAPVCVPSLCAIVTVWWPLVAGVLYVIFIHQLRPMFFHRLLWQAKPSIYIPHHLYVASPLCFPSATSASMWRTRSFITTISCFVAIRPIARCCCVPSTPLLACLPCLPVLRSALVPAGLDVVVAAPSCALLGPHRWCWRKIGRGWTG